MANSFVIVFSHIIPPIMGFIGIILMCTGIMDKNNQYTLAGIVIFFAAGIIPFLILPSLLA
jgi:hypothetical protein